MDAEVTRQLAELDQTRAELGSAVAAMPRSEQAELIRRCASGRLADLDERTALLVGLLAMVAAFDLTRPAWEDDEPHAA
jgi:hypothetical protein